MKVSNFYLAIILILAGILAGQAQALAWQYSYERDEDGSGKPSFVLNLNPEYAASMGKKAKALP